MGNKEAKFKKAFEDIDTSGDKKISIKVKHTKMDFK